MCTGVGRRSFLTAQPCIEGTVFCRAPNLVQPTGWRLGMTQPDWLFQHLGVMGLKCAVTGGGTTGHMHSKPQGFSTQPTIQPVTGMSVVSCLLKRYIGIHETFGHITQGVR